MPSRTDTNRRSNMSSRKDDPDRDRNRKDHPEKTHSSEHNTSRKRDTIKSSQNSSSRRSSPPKHSSKTDRSKVEDNKNDRRSSHHRPDKSSSSLRASNSHHSTGRNEDGNRREAKKTETLKRPRSKSPTQRHRTDQDRKHRRTEQENPAKNSERKEIVVKKEEPVTEFGNSGFGNSGFGNSGFGNSGFGDSSGGFKKSGTNFGLNSNFGGSGNFNSKAFGRRDHNNDAGKSRIVGPNDGFGIENKQEKSELKMVIVNELSMDSIKRDEHPLKGTMTTKRTRGGGPFIGQRNAVGRGGGNQNSFGMARGPTGGFGARGGFNSGRPNFDRTAEPPNSKDVRYSSSRNSINEHGDGGKSVDSDEKPPLNPLAVPRGRNYFLHDHRDAIADDNRLYDPRLDHGGSNSFRRGTGTRERGGGRGGPPIGWRNFESTDGNEKESAGAFSRRGGRGGFTRGGGFAGDEPAATDGSRPSWRSKADEDRVWKHDKYMEISQEEVDTKLELVDEADGEQTIDGSKEDGRQRYQEDEYLEYETEWSLTID